MIALSMAAGLTGYIGIPGDTHLLHAQLSMLSWLILRVERSGPENHRLLAFNRRDLLGEELDRAATRTVSVLLLCTPAPALLGQETCLYDDLGDGDSQVDPVRLRLSSAPRPGGAVAPCLGQFLLVGSLRLTENG